LAVRDPAPNVPVDIAALLRALYLGFSKFESQVWRSTSLATVACVAGGFAPVKRDTSYIVATKSFYH